MSPLHIIRMKIILVLLLLVVGLITITITVVEAAPNTTVVQAYCDQNSWLYGNYEGFISGTLKKVAADVSADQNYVGHELTHIGYNYYVYGYGECDTTISPTTDCYDCLCAAASQLTTNCYGQAGGWVKMADCMIEYDDYNFS